MTLLCQVCNRHPFPSFGGWQKEVEKQLEACQSTTAYNLEPHSFRSIANHLATYIESLKEELEAANKTLESTLSILAPISRISDDLLLYIFEELFFEPSGNRSTTSDVYPYTLVSKRWRNIITGYPKFWTRISFPSGYGLLDSWTSSSISRYFNTHLSRSARLPLSLVSYATIPTSSLMALQPAFDRITSLHAYHDDQGTDETLASCFLLPNLSQLFLDIDQSGWDDVLSDSSISIELQDEDVPQLRHIELSLECQLREIALPWAQLTTLKIRLHDGGDFTPYFWIRELQRIEILELDFGACYEEDENGDRSSVILPRLHSLAVACYDDHSFPFWLLQNATSPSLEQLSVRLSPGSYNRFTQAIDTSQLWNITQLRLDFVAHSLNTVVPTVVEGTMNSLSKFASLKSLYCDAGNSATASCLLEVLSNPGLRSGEFLFPSLESLEIRRAHLDQQTLALLRKLLESRVSRVVIPVDARIPLRTVLVAFDYEYDFKFYRKYEITKQDFKPQQYNDRATSVKMVARGELPSGFLKQEVTVCQLF